MSLPSGNRVLSPNPHNPRNVFHNFEKLPTELRVRIWRLSIPIKRIVKIRDFTGFEQDLFPEGDRLRVLQKIPAVLHTNQESRTETMKYYTTPFSTRLKQPLYFNFSRDVLVFDGESSCWEFLDFFNYWSEDIHDIRRKSDWQRIKSELRHLIIGDSAIIPFSSQTYALLAEFSQLDSLVLPYFDSSLWRLHRWPGLPLGIAWRILQREWLKKRVENGRSGRNAGFVGQLIPAAMEDIEYMKGLSDIYNIPLLDSIDYSSWLHAIDGKRELEWRPWPAPTEIKFLHSEEIKRFILELEMREI
jgi:hypothetical protein